MTSALQTVSEALTTVPGTFAPWPVLPSTMALFVGEAVNFTPSLSLATPTITLTRRPALSSAVVTEGNAITFDTPGRFVVDLTVAGAARQFACTVFPVAIKQHPDLAFYRDGTTPRPATEIRTILTALAASTDLSKLADLEAVPVTASSTSGPGWVHEIKPIAHSYLGMMLNGRQLSQFGA